MTPEGPAPEWCSWELFIGAITADFQRAPEHHSAFTSSPSFDRNREEYPERFVTIRGTDFCGCLRSSLQGQNPDFS